MSIARVIKWRFTISFILNSQQLGDHWCSTRTSNRRVTPRPASRSVDHSSGPIWKWSIKLTKDVNGGSSQQVHPTRRHTCSWRYFHCWFVQRVRCVLTRSFRTHQRIDRIEIDSELIDFKVTGRQQVHLVSNSWESSATTAASGRDSHIVRTSLPISLS